MKIWFTLYRYELKKIMQKKITVAVLLGICLFISTGLLLDDIGSVQVNGMPNYMKKAELNALDRKNGLEMTGRRIEEGLIRKTAEAYRRNQELTELYGDTPTEEQKRLLAEDYIENVRPYSAIMDHCGNALGMKPAELMNWDADMKEYDTIVRKRLKEQCKNYRLTEREEAFWMNYYDSLEKPVTYEYDRAYPKMTAIVYALSVFMMLLFGVAFSGVFSEERILRCDQLILSSKNGREKIYYAKLAAGLTFAMAAWAGILLLSVSILLAIYGTEGFSASLQLYKPLYPYPVSVGSFVLIMFGVMFVVLLFVSVMVLFLSVCFRHTVTPLAIVITAIIMGLFLNIPESMRIPAQIWDMLLTNFIYASNIYDLRLFTIMGHSFVPWQVLPFLYFLVSIGIFLLGEKIYCKIG